MYQTDYEPPAILTTGAIGKLAAASALNHETVAKLLGAMANISERIDRLERERSDDAFTRAVVVR